MTLRVFREEMHTADNVVIQEDNNPGLSQFEPGVADFGYGPLASVTSQTSIRDVAYNEDLLRVLRLGLVSKSRESFFSRTMHRL